MNDRLIRLRKAKNLTQTELQRQTGIDQALLSKFETGERVPNTDKLLVLADYYNVSIDYILGRTDRPEVNR